MSDTAAGTTSPSFRVVLLGLSFAYLLLHLPFLDQVPPIIIDESWYANSAHNLANGQGFINTNVGAFPMGDLFFYTLIVSGAFKVFGTGLWIGRFVSVLMGLIALWGWGVLCRRLGLRGWPFVVTSGLFITSNVYFILFRRERPEALVIALSVWALYFFITAWQTGNFNPALACALLAGSSALAHPNGSILAVLLGILLAACALSNRGGARAVLGYAAGGIGTIVILLIGWELLRERPLLEFLKVVFLTSGRVSVSEGTILSAFWTNLTTFVPSYSLGLKRLYILVFELGILLVGMARYRHDRLAGFLGLTGLLYFLAGLVLLTPFKPYAFSIVLLFSLAVTGRLLNLGVTTISGTWLKALWLATLLYGLNNLAGDVYVLNKNATNTPYTRLTETLDATIPDGVPVLTHIEFWFAFQNNSVYTQFRQFKRWSATPYTDFRQLQESGHIRYAVLSPALEKGVSPTTGEMRGISESSARFYQEARMYARAHCQRISLLATRGYGEIEIWECPPRVILTPRS